jgi:hypothetical protein
MMSGGAVEGNMLSGGASSYGKEVLVGGNRTFKISGEARPQRVFLSSSSSYSYYPSVTIAGPLNGGSTPIDLGGDYDIDYFYFNNAVILKLDAAYTGGNLASLKYNFGLGNFKLTDSPYTETPITGYAIDDNGLLQRAPSTGISGITYSSVPGSDEWTLISDGSRVSPAINNNAITKSRVSFTSTMPNAFIVIQLDVSSAIYDYAFISALDDASATYDSGYYSGSRIHVWESVRVVIPVPTTGSHFVDIAYQKDGAGKDGSDCAWFKVIE